MKHTEDTLKTKPNADINGILRQMVYGNDKDIIRLNLDFCTNAGVVMVLAFEHKIGVEFIDGFGWTASHPYNQISASCYDNPLRAVVMCLILHLQERGV